MSDIKKTEDILNVSGAAYDHKHINNLCDRAVSQEILDQIEQGCPIETLEEIAGDFPICKYLTQITIHGRFPVTSTRRIGEYVNLVRNKNESIGIRWTAIDHEKKQRLFKACSIAAGFGVIENSTTFHLRKVKPITRETATTVLDGFKSEVARIDKSLYTGEASVWVGSVFGSLFAVFEVDVKSFYERNFDALCSCICGMTKTEIDQKIAEHDEAERLAREENERKWAESEARFKQSERERSAANKSWIAANPPSFPKVDNHTLEVGDIYALPDCSVNRLSDPRYGYYDHWTYFKVSKSFGRLTVTPCDIDGNPVETRDTFGCRVKGHAIRNPKAAGAYYLKPSAVKVVTSPKTKKTPLPASVRPATAAATGKPEMRLNEAKHGVELRFNGIPSEIVRTSLKSNGWRWSKFSRCWYAQDSERSRAFASRLCN